MDRWNDIYLATIDQYICQLEQMQAVTDRILLENKLLSSNVYERNLRLYKSRERTLSGLWVIRKRLIEQ